MYKDLSESIYKNIFENLPQAVWVYEIPSLKILTANKEAANIFGYSQEEFCSLTIKDIRPVEEMPALNNDLEKIKEFNMQINGIRNYKKKDNSILTLEMFSENISYNSFKARIVVAKNTFDEKSIENEKLKLKGEEIKFDVLTEAAPVLIWMSDANKFTYYFNKRWLAFTGKDLNKEVGDGWKNDIHPDDLERCIKIYESNFEKRIEFKLEYRLKRFDGVYRWVLSHGVPLFTSDGNFNGYIGSCIDITERKNAEEIQKKLLDNEQAALKEAAESNKRMLFLTRAGEILNSSLNYEKTLAHLSEIITPELADWYVVDIPDDNDNLKRIAVSHVDPRKIKLAYEIHEKYPPKKDNPYGAYEVMRTGKPFLFEEITDQMLKSAIQDEAHYRIIKDLGLKSAMVIPLKFQNKILGVITLVNAESQRVYNNNDLKFTEELAQKAANAINNSRYYYQAQNLNTKLDERIRELQDEISKRKKIEKTLIVNERLLKKSEARYKNIFNTAAISIIEQDFSKVIKYIDEIVIKENKNIRSFLEDSKESLHHVVSLIKNVDANFKTIDLFQAGSKKSFLSSINELLLPENYQVIKEEIIAIAENRKYFESETTIKTFRGELRNVLITISFPEHSFQFNSVLVCIIDITERKRIELEKERLNAELEAAKKRIDRIISNVPGLVWEAWGQPDKNDQKIDFVSDYVEEMLGYSADEWISTPNFWLKIVHPEDKERAAHEASEIFSGKRVGKSEFRWFTKNGEVIHVEAHSTVIYDPENNPIGMRGVTMDVTERKIAEEQRENSLKEKEVLLREIHHRVKNNLQIVSSLLNLQANYIKDPEAYELFKDSRNRVKSMALIHEKLYQTKEFTEINFHEYTKDLLEYLFSLYNVSPGDLKLTINIDNIYLNIDKSISLGLIINELLSNILKHAFTSKMTNKQIEISFMKMEGRFTLIVGDNGKGLAEEIDLEYPHTLGLQLVSTLAQQILADVTIERNNGTKFILSLEK